MIRTHIDPLYILSLRIQPCQLLYAPYRYTAILAELFVLIVSHNAARVARMEDPTKRFASSIRRVEDTWDMDRSYITTLKPRLDTECRGVNMLCTFCWMAGFDDFDASFVIFIKGSWCSHRVM